MPKIELTELVLEIYAHTKFADELTGMKPTEISTDASGVSDMVFGLFWLLGYQFSPELADTGEAVLWRIDKSADYDPLAEVARGCINTQRAAQYWDIR